MPKVFISYSRKDIEYAACLHKALEERGLEVWRDVQDMPIGKQFPEETAKAIQATDMMILLWSVHSSNSYFVNLEWNTAIAQKRPLMPIFLGELVALPVALSPFNGFFSVDADADAERIALNFGKEPDMPPLEPKKGLWTPNTSPADLAKKGAIVGLFTGFVVLALLASNLILGHAQPVWKVAGYCATLLVTAPLKGGAAGSACGLDTSNVSPKPPHICTHKIVGQVFEQVDSAQPLPLQKAIATVKELRSCPQWSVKSKRLVTDAEGKFVLKFCPFDAEHVQVKVESLDGNHISQTRIVNLLKPYGTRYVLNKVGI